MKQYNEKPSKYKNLGQDVQGARRHKFDTYETDAERKESLRVKAKVKQYKKDRAEIVNQIEAGNNVKHNLLEFARIQAMQDENFTKLFNYVDFTQSETPYEYLLNVTKKTIENRLRELKAYRENDELYRNLYRSWDKARKTFNRLIRLVYRIERLDYDSENCIEKALQLIGKRLKKASFTGYNGIKGPWKLEHPFKTESLDFLKNKGITLQFGNSLTEAEREYCIENLATSIQTLSKVLNFDFTSVGYSFGARGLKGSIAHYESSRKVLAFNRHCSGAFLHELGHAIDHSLGLISYQIPQSFFNDYALKLEKHKVPNASYYLNNKEYFARLFEVYIVDLLSREQVPSFTQTTRNEEVMPELTLETRQYMTMMLDSILKK